MQVFGSNAPAIVVPPVPGSLLTHELTDHCTSSNYLYSSSVESIKTFIPSAQFTEYNLPMSINFEDFKSSFDYISREFIWKAVDHYSLLSKYIRIVQAFFDGTACAVRVNGEPTDWFDVGSGTGQGDIQGPPLFNIATHMAETNKEVSKGLVLIKDPVGENEQKILDTDYADDLALLDDNKEVFQESKDLLSQYASLAGLKINARKTECMAIGKWTSQRPFTEVNRLDLNRNIQTRTKIRIYKAAVLTVLLYRSEVGNTTKKQRHRLEVLHQQCL